MFRDASSFNEPIGNWDVSSGTEFVSSDHGVRFDSKRSIVLLCFQLGCRVSQSITDVWRFSTDVFSTNHCFPLFSEVCSYGPQALSKTLEVGTFPKRTLLELFGGPRCMTRIIRWDVTTPGAGVNHLRSSLRNYRSIHFLTHWSSMRKC
jgi:hypothetical protein